MKPLSPSCRACRTAPTHQTRQRAIGARPTLAWYQCCSDHVPGSRIHLRPVEEQAAAWTQCNRFHESRPLAVEEQ